MTISQQSRLQQLQAAKLIPLLRGIKRGFEKECLRVDTKGELSTLMHPLKLGSSLMHPMITTDYSESLLEFITPPTDHLQLPFQYLQELHQNTYRCLEDEFLWASSMPCVLPAENDIPIAYYGDSNVGQLKTVYRRGLGLRYGRTMQMIAGIHYNFSLSDDFFEKYRLLLGSHLPLKDFVSEQYLGLIRNVMRWAWILPLLFGASPAIASSFLKKPVDELEKLDNHTWIGPYATSLRLSDIGYHNSVQNIVPISYDTLQAFEETMHKSVHTAYPLYTKFGIHAKNGEYQQLSDCILQIEDEHYALVRPKRVSKQDERMLSAIKRDGIEYVEIRALDINPFLMLGVSPEMTCFMDSFLLMCVLAPSPPLTETENQHIRDNHNKIVKQGRKPDLNLINSQEKSISVQEWAQQVLENTKSAAILLDEAYGLKTFTESCKESERLLSDFNLLPSSRVLHEMENRKESYTEFAWRRSKTLAMVFKGAPLPAKRAQFYSDMAEKSLADQKALGDNTDTEFEAFRKLYLSH